MYCMFVLFVLHFCTNVRNTCIDLCNFGIVKLSQRKSMLLALPIDPIASMVHLNFLRKNTVIYLHSHCVHWSDFQK